MNKYKEVLKNDLIKYLKKITNDKYPLEQLTYEELLEKYLNILLISPSEWKEELDSARSKYQVDYPDESIEDIELIYAMKLLTPASLSYLVSQKIGVMEIQIGELQQWLEFYKDELITDMTKMGNKSYTSPEEKNDLYNDISYDKKVVMTYPEMIVILKAEISKNKEVLDKLFNVLNLGI